MLLAYLDEIGSPGPFIHPKHPRYSDSAAFGYGGFIIPEENARELGATFAKIKKQFFHSEIPDSKDPGQWEKKGSDLLFALVAEERPQNLRILGSLISKLGQLKGRLFYYAEEKPVGSPKEINWGKKERQQLEETAMRETLNRIARYANDNNSCVLILMDQINEKSRIQRLPKMYAHILGRSSEHKEMRRIIEPPMHLDSELSTNIQLADWICALVKRDIEYQLVEDSRYAWVPKAKQLKSARELFTFESKLHLCQRSIADINRFHILDHQRPVLDFSTNNLNSGKNKEQLSRVLKASFKHSPS